MGKIALTQHTSLDGVMQSPGPHGRTVQVQGLDHGLRPGPRG